MTSLGASMADRAMLYIGGHAQTTTAPWEQAGRGVTAMRHEQTAWLCWERDFDAAWMEMAEIKAGPTAPRMAFAQFLGFIRARGPVLATDGTHNGCSEMRRQLAQQAALLGVLPIAFYPEAPASARLTVVEGFKGPDWWEAARADLVCVPESVRLLVDGPYDTLVVPLSDALQALDHWKRLPGWEDGPRDAPQPITLSFDTETRNA